MKKTLLAIGVLLTSIVNSSAFDLNREVLNNLYKSLVHKELSSDVNINNSDSNTIIISNTSVVKNLYRAITSNYEYAGIHSGVYSDGTYNISMLVKNDETLLLLMCLKNPKFTKDMAYIECSLTKTDKKLLRF